jgi:hypothetical protein
LELDSKSIYPRAFNFYIYFFARNVMSEYVINLKDKVYDCK